MSEAASVQGASNDADATPGVLLKRERERAALTVRQAAEDLHLDAWIIEAIEANRFLALGAPVYAKGHLRKYATRLGLSVEDIFARYEALQDRPHEADPIPTAVATPIRPPRRSLKGPLWIAALIAVAAVLGYLAFELFMPQRAPSPTLAAAPTSDSVAPANVETTSDEDLQSAPAEPAPEPQPQSSDDVATTTASTRNAEAGPSTAEPSAPTSGAAPVTVRLEFTGESWTEVYDATGARLLFGMGTPQRVRTLVGVPPIQVNLGAASAVSMQINGESVVIPRREGRESARFTIDADGNLR